MSDSLTLSEEAMLSPNSSASKTLNLTKDLSDQEVYKNNNNNIIEDTTPASRDVSGYSVDNDLADEKRFVKSEPSSEDCKMSTFSPKEKDEGASMTDEENTMQYSPKSINLGSGKLEQSFDHTNSVGGNKYPPNPDYSLTSPSHKRPIFNALSENRDRHLRQIPEYEREDNHSFEGRHREMTEHSHDYSGVGSDLNEDMSDNEMICDDFESESESNEPRITVREALMNRALAAAAAAAATAGSSSSVSHFPERGTENFSNEHGGGSGRTSRSGGGGVGGGISPSSSPGVRSSSTSGIASGRNENNSSSNISVSKEPFVNGHGLRPPVSHSSGERYHHHSHNSQQHSHQQRSSYGAHHHQHHGQQQLGSHSSSSTNKHNQQQYRDSSIKSSSDSKSHPSSPLHSVEGMKPENLAALSNLSNIQSSIGNALFNLASLGSLAALQQQSLPGLLSSVGSSNSSSGGGGNGSALSPSHTLPQTGSGSTSSPSLNSALNAPLNLTHSSGSTLTSKNLHSGHGNSSNNGNLRSQHSSSPTGSNQFSHQSSAFSHCNSTNSGNQSLPLGGGGIGGMIPPNLAAYFSQSAAAVAAAGGIGPGSSPSSSSFIPNSSQLTNSLSHAAAAANIQSPGSLPQLVLASGQIMQGIQGAQLLIPTSSGIMTQMILTIPLTQPGSPQSLMSTTPSHNTSPAIGSASGQQRSSSPHSRTGRNQSRSHHHHHHGLPQCSANSPPIGSTVPPSASPDFSGPGGAMSNSLLNLSPHLVNQSLGAHIPLDKMGMDRTGNMNGVRSGSLKRDNAGSVISPNSNLPMSTMYPPKMSPCSGSGHESDKCSEGGDSDQMVDGINLDEIKEFAKAFKLRRLSLGLTQTQVGQALSVTEGPAYSQSAICSALAWQLAQSQSQLSQSNRTSLPQQSMFEKLDITPKSAQKIKPVLERWMKEAEDRYKNGHQNLNDFVGMEPSKKRKRRTSFTPQALEILNTQFERNTHPSGAEITTLAHQLGYEREVIRIWFCNKRQALKNTVRMMSKGSSPI